MKYTNLMNLPGNLVDFSVKLHSVCLDFLAKLRQLSWFFSKNPPGVDFSVKLQQLCRVLSKALAAELVSQQNSISCVDFSGKLCRPENVG